MLIRELSDCATERFQRKSVKFSSTLSSVAWPRVLTRAIVAIGSHTRICQPGSFSSGTSDGMTFERALF